MAEDDATVPPAVRLVRDFVNTYEPQVDDESLTSPDRLRDWLAERHLLDTEVRLQSSDVDVTLALREGLRSVLLTHAGHRADPPAITALDAALAQVPLRLAVTEAAGFRLMAARDSALETALAQLLDAIRQATEDHTWARLKVCARDSCRWAYYDASRNQTRRWCSMAGCGNHIKMKRAYATRRTRHQQPAAVPPTADPPWTSHPAPDVS